MIRARSVMELPDELQRLILDRMNYVTLQSIRSVDPDLVDVHMERIAYRARRKFPNVFDQGSGDAEIVEKVYYLNDCIRMGAWGWWGAWAVDGSPREYVLARSPYENVSELVLKRLLVVFVSAI
jgi:hypothetical protein